MKKISKIECPVYVGIFFPPEIIKNFNYDGIKLNTYSHITLKYLGNELNIPPVLSKLLNKTIYISIIGISDSYAGKAFVIKNNLPINIINPHITLIVNNNFKPVDVGYAINNNNITNIKPIKLKGIITTYGEYFNKNNNSNTNTNKKSIKKINKKSIKKINKKSIKKINKKSIKKINKIK